MLGTEVEHALCFFDAADQRAGQAPSFENERKGLDRGRGFRCPDEDHGPVGFKQVQVGVVIVWGRNRIEDVVEIPLEFRKRLRVRRHRKVCCP